MNITRTEIIAAIAGVCAAAAAVSSVTAAVNQPPAGGVAEFELGKTTSVEDWTFNKFGGTCSVSGMLTYEVEGPVDLTGIIRGSVDTDFGRQFVTGTMIDGEGEMRLAVNQFNNEDVCDLKKASDLEITSTQISVIPAVVTAID